MWVIQKLDFVWNCALQQTTYAPNDLQRVTTQSQNQYP